MPRFKHPNIKPDLVVEVPEDRAEAHAASGWLPVFDTTVDETVTIQSPRRRRKGISPEEGTEND